MKRTLIGALASLALATSAFAGDSKSTTAQDKSTTREDSSGSYGTGGSGSATGSMGSSDSTTSTGSAGTTMKDSSASASDKGGLASGNELTGTVVRADKKMLYVEHMGAVVPLKLDSKTRFEGDTLKSSKDLKEGQDIRASFTVEGKTNNVATSIGLSSESGKGGSGFNTDLNQGGINDHGNVPGSDMNSPSIPPSDVDSNNNLPQPERSPSTPLPEEPGTQSNNPTY